MVLFLEYLVFFEVVFCLEQLEMICRMYFDMFFGILFFDPKWRFCKGYSLCMMGDFQNGLISRIFSVFWSGFLLEQLEMICRMDFDMFFGILIFDPKWGFCKGYIAFAWWAIFKMVSFLEYSVFFEAVFCLEQLEMICRMDFDMFFRMLIFDPKWGFCKSYCLCMMGDFQNGLISRKFSVFWSGFLHRRTRNDL